MALREQDIRVVKPSPATEEESRRKAEFDSSMTMIRHYARFADREAAEYFFREMTRETKALARRYGFKVLA